MQYLDKRREMRQNGYSERDIADSFAFLYIDDDKQVGHDHWCIFWLSIVVDVLCVCVYTTDVQYHLFLASVTWTCVHLGETPESLVLKAVAICNTLFTIGACFLLECCDCVDSGVVNIKNVVTD